MEVHIKDYKEFLESCIFEMQKHSDQKSKEYKPKYTSFLGWLFRVKSKLTKYENSVEGERNTSTIKTLKDELLFVEYEAAMGSTVVEANLLHQGKLSFCKFYFNKHKESNVSST
jgi:hypothetical protein